LTFRSRELNAAERWALLRAEDDTFLNVAQRGTLHAAGR
jgi:hypothetical protein